MVTPRPTIGNRRGDMGALRHRRSARGRASPPAVARGTPSPSGQRHGQMTSKGRPPPMTASYRPQTHSTSRAPHERHTQSRSSPTPRPSRRARGGDASAVQHPQVFRFRRGLWWSARPAPLLVHSRPPGGRHDASTHAPRRLVRPRHGHTLSTRRR